VDINKRMAWRGSGLPQQPSEKSASACTICMTISLKPPTIIIGRFRRDVGSVNERVARGIFFNVRNGNAHRRKGEKGIIAQQREMCLKSRGGASYGSLRRRQTAHISIGAAAAAAISSAARLVPPVAYFFNVDV